MGICLWYWVQASGSLPRGIAALGGVVLGAILYGFAIALMKVPELQSAIRFVARKVKP
jgi:uncharacterized integral membrane protein